MALREAFSHVVTGSAGRLLEGRFRTLVSDVVRDQDLASAAEVDALRRRLADLDQRTATLEDRLAAQERRAEEEALGRAEARARAPEREVVPEATCQVPGCTGAYRSKGFCSPHYQRWRRGTLNGFVRPDGTVADGSRRWKVGVALAGAPVEIDGPEDARMLRARGEPVTARLV